MPTPPAMPESVALRMLAPPLKSVESVSLTPPAAVRRMSTSGLSVSCLCFQNISLDREVRRTAENCCTAMS